MTRRMRYIALFLPFFFSFLLPSEKDIQLKIPVRIYTDMADQNQPQYLKDLSLDGVKLSINNLPTQIAEFIPRNRSLATTETVSHGVVLSVDVSGNAQPLIDAVCSWVKQYIRSSDRLMLRTPVDIYSIDTRDLAKSSSLISTILENDLLQGQRNKYISLENLNNLLESVEHKLDNKKIGIRSAMLFASHFHENWRQFLEQILFANLKLFSNTAERFADFKGEAYIIHFQERTVLPILTGFQRVQDKMKVFADKLPKSARDNGKVLLTTLEKCRKSMLFSGELDIDKLLNVLLGVNVNCNMIFVNPLTASLSEVDSPTMVSSGFETILKSIAYQTGGETVEAKWSKEDLLNALKSITNHRDYFYDLVWNFNGKVENKSLMVDIIPPENKDNFYQIFYKRYFNKEESNWLMQYLEKQEFSILSFTLEKRTLSFSVTGYHWENNSTNKKATIQIEIKLIDDSGTPVFETAKKLHPFEPSIEISLALPPAHKGYFKLQILVTDETTGKRVDLNKYIKLD